MDSCQQQKMLIFKTLPTFAARKLKLYGYRRSLKSGHLLLVEDTRKWPQLWPHLKLPRVNSSSLSPSLSHTHTNTHKKTFRFWKFENGAYCCFFPLMLDHSPISLSYQLGRQMVHKTLIMFKCQCIIDSLVMLLFCSHTK